MKFLLSISLLFSISAFGAESKTDCPMMRHSQKRLSSNPKAMFLKESGSLRVTSEKAGSKGRDE